MRDTNRKRPLGAAGGGEGPYRHPPPPPGRGQPYPHPHHQQQHPPPSSGFLNMSSRLGAGLNHGGGSDGRPEPQSMITSWPPPQQDGWGDNGYAQPPPQQPEGGRGGFVNPRVMKKFVPPVKGSNGGGGMNGGPSGIRGMVNRAFKGPTGNQQQQQGPGGAGGSEEEELPEELKGCDPKLVESVMNDIIDKGDPITFEDIAGLAFAKKTIMELICWPMARPDLFTGLRALPRGLLLFGYVRVSSGFVCVSGMHEAGNQLPTYPLPSLHAGRPARARP